MNMSQINTMKQILARSLRYKIETMCWSSKMDLIAIGNDKGEVIVHRLNWQKICVLASPGENIKVRAISWQIDETVIAVAYSNGKISLYDVEKDDEIYFYELHSDVKTLHWSKPVISDDIDIKSELKFENYLTPLPNLSTISSSARKSSLTFSKSTPSFLIVSLVNGLISISVLGVLPCGLINLKEHVNNPNDFELFDVQIGSTFDEIIVYIRDGSEISCLMFKNIILTKSIPSLFNLAKKHGYILETLNYINDTIQCIVEAWETVLIEMDNKLTKYANTQPEGAVSADFLELLLFGVPSVDLEKFLTRDLTEKGLKKLGTSIELSYLTIQNLVVRPLHCAAINLFYYLNNLKGLSKNTYFYKNLISKEATETAIRNTGSFLLKNLEFQQAINQSVNDYKIFWCWLSIIIIRLLDESIPEDVTVISQEDITHLANFLYDFDDCIFEKEDGTKVKRKFHLERVGQYLVDTKIDFTEKLENMDDWYKLLEENQCLKNSQLIFPSNNDMSLIQERNLLKESINNLFAKPHESIGDAFNLKCRLHLGIANPNSRKLLNSHYLCKSNSSDLIAVSINNSILFIQKLLSNDLKVIKLIFMTGHFTSLKSAELFNQCIIKDIAFYNESILSILLKATSTDGKKGSYFVQMPLDLIKERATTISITDNMSMNNALQLNVLDYLDSNYFKPVEGKCSKIAVSGSRKISSILSDTGMKIRIYEMDIEDDDDEMEVSTNPIDTSRE